MVVLKGKNFYFMETLVHVRIKFVLGPYPHQFAENNNLC